MKITKKHKNKLIISLVIVFAVAAISYGMVQVNKKTPGISQSNNSIKQIDTSIGQYPDKANAPAPLTSNTLSSSIGSPAVSVPSTPLSSTCALQLTLQPNVSSVRNGDQIIYSVSIKNNSVQSCEGVSLSLYYSDNEKFVSSDLRPTSSNYYWKIGQLKATQQRNFKITTQATQNTSTNIHTDSCASGNNAVDSCSSSDIIISGVYTSRVNTGISPSPVVQSPAPVSTSVGTVTSNPITSSGKEYGVWVWVSPIQMSKSYMNSVINEAKANQINTLYVTIDDYLDILALPDGSQKQSQEAAYTSALENLVSVAHANGIAVDAEAGWRDWSEDPKRTKAFAIIDYVVQYNKQHPNAALTGFQYDVEPYLLPSYENNKATILAHYVSFVDDSAVRLGSNPIRFSIVIPHFYDSVQNWTPSFTYKNVSGYAFDHLLKIMDSRPSSSIIIMAYRNYAVGDNGSIQISQTEVTQASTGTHSTKIIIGQETGNVTPSYVTFYSKTKNYYLQQINIIKNTFSSNTGFGGMAVHYIDTFQELK